MTIINPKSIAGVTSITTPSGSDNLFTVHTNNTTERIRINNDGDVIVGSGITVSPDGDIFATGVCTATSFVGSGANLTGVASTENIRTNTNATFLQNINVSGTSTVGGDLNIADKIVHIGDTDTAIRFSGADTITAETGGSSRFKIDSSGNVTIGNDGDSGSNPSSGYDELCIEGGNEAIGMCFLSPAANDVEQTIAFGDSNNNQSGKIQYEHANDAMHFDTGGTERLRIDSSGRVLIGTTDVGGGNADDLTVATSGNTGITIRSGTSNTGNIFWSDATSGSDQYIGALEYHHSDNQFKFNISNTTRMTVDSTGDVTISDGDLVIGTSGHGIDFSATANAGNSASMSNELLDDYEEGSWVPDMHDGSVTANSCSYTKVGRLVTIVGFLYSFTDNSTNDQVKIGGLPYAAAVNGVACGTVMYNNISETNNTVLYMNSQSQLLQYGGDSGSFSQIRHNELNSSSTFYIFAQYMAAT